MQINSNAAQISIPNTYPANKSMKLSSNNANTQQNNILKSFFDLKCRISELNCWQSTQFTIANCQVQKITSNLEHNNGTHWSLSALLEDCSGESIECLLDNSLIEKSMQMTASECIVISLPIQNLYC